MQPPKSLAESLAFSPQREKILASLSQADLAALKYAWDFWARPDQRAPKGDWDTWLISSGRGWGKTRTGAEWVREEHKNPDSGGRFAIIAATHGDLYKVILEGDSGLYAIFPPDQRPKYNGQKGTLTFHNGAIANLFTAEEPERLRGPQFGRAWCDELAAWRYPEAWDQLQFGLRIGKRPKVCVTTTPRPTPIIRALIADPGTRLTRGSTYDNKSNLAPAFLRKMLAKYEGTRLGRQELMAEVLGDTPGALWKLDPLDADRVRVIPPLSKVVVAIDPSATDSEESDEAGIVVVGLGEDGHGYVLEDLSGRMSPTEWATTAVLAYAKWKANFIVAEVNQGGDMVGTIVQSTAKTLRQARRLTEHIAFTTVHASKGKRARAEPVSALYEQHKVHHVGVHAALESQMTTWDASTGAKSPDRIDALVYAVTAACLGAETPEYEYSIDLPSAF